MLRKFGRGTSLSWIAVFLTLVTCVPGFVLPAIRGQAQIFSEPPAAQYRTLLNRYCVTCHNEKLHTAGLTLEKLDVEKTPEGAAVWEKVIQKLRTRAMPPAGAAKPDDSAYDGFASYLETALDRAAAADPNPGRPTLRRLNRAEYRNAVRDLLSIDYDVATLLPADDSRYGFDNVGDVLTISPLLSERYIAAARKISRLAVGDPSTGPGFETYDVPKYLMQDDRVAEDLPFGSRGGTAIRHVFPLDGEYVVKIRLQRNSRDYIRGLAEAHQLDLRLGGTRIKSFIIGGEHRGRSAPVFSSGQIGDVKQEDYERTADDALQFRFPVKAGTHLVSVDFLKQSVVPEGPLQPRMTQYDFTQYKGGQPAVATIAIGGPYQAAGPGDTLSRRIIFICRPAMGNDEEPCAEKTLSALAHRAYRRPLQDDDVKTLMNFYNSGRRDGGFEEGIETALERILAGPEFLFRIERDPQKAAPDTPYRISDLELASRLSFFLWSSIPDQELLEVAEKGGLRDPVILEQQTRRMLADSRSKALVSNFAGQWLYLRNLSSISPDSELFPYFDDNLRDAFRQETELFFESMLREDRSLLDLLRADYTFVNERLAQHYGITNIYGDRFRRVRISKEERRGLLGQGSILTVTSYANRTSPVIRGKWVLENILDAPPPPPPPNVPALKDHNAEGKILSMRQQMEQHRANPVCASCHRVMDPIGFALENFDATGMWRTTDATAPIDPSGVLPDGTKFDGPAGLRGVLLQRGEQFANTVTERLLTYALGRGVEYYDAPAVRKIVREAASNDYRWSSIILGIIKSTPFQMRRSQPS